jgi:hypothetical protein
MSRGEIDAVGYSQLIGELLTMIIEKILTVGKCKKMHQNDSESCKSLLTDSLNIARRSRSPSRSLSPLDLLASGLHHPHNQHRSNSLFSGDSDLDLGEVTAVATCEQLGVSGRMAGWGHTWIRVVLRWWLPGEQDASHNELPTAFCDNTAVTSSGVCSAYFNDA